MPMKRVRFQPDLSIPEFIKFYGTEAQCDTALMQARWPNGFHCPACGHNGHFLLTNRSWLALQCNACHRQNSVIAGTVFQSSNLPLRIRI